MRWQKKREAPYRAWIASALSALRATLGTLASSWRTWLPQFLLIAGMTLWIYWPALRGGLIWDDQWYITMNPSLHDTSGLWKFWFRPGSWVEYYPVHETVLWLQWQLWGENTLGYHLTSVFLHIINALLVWRLLGKFGLRFAWLGGLIFAIHPVQVDSVAYICELKNTLSLPCFLLAMGSWINYENSKSKRDYENALALFLVAMLCKISMAPFPAVNLLYAWWKRGRIDWSDAKACAPFLLIGFVLAFVTAWAGDVYEKAGHNLIGGTPLTGVLSRIDAVGLDATVYFARCFLPVDIMLVYSQWSLHPHALIQYLPWLVFAGVVYVLWTKRRTWGRHVLLGLGFFLLVLSPFLGFIGVSYMNFAWVMDHYLYIPIIGLIGLVVAGVGDLAARIPARSRPFAVGISAGLVGLMAWVSHAFAGLFVSEEIFWTHVLQRNPTVWIARQNLGSRLLELERYPEAIEQEKAAISLRPDSWDGYYNLAFALAKLGRDQESEEQYRVALRLNPGYPKIYLNLGEMKRRTGQMAEAEAIFRQGLKMVPDDASLGTDLAGILEQTGRVSEAIEVYQHVADLNPDLAPLQYDLGTALFHAGKLPEAEEHFENAVTLDPKIASAHENLGVILAQSGRLPEAIEQFQDVIEIDPQSLTARNNLAMALAQTGNIPGAIEQFKKVLEINPGDAKARETLAKLQQIELQRNTQGQPAQ